MSDWFDANILDVAYRLELVTDDAGAEHIRWHAAAGAQAEAFDHDPLTRWYQRLFVKLASVLPLESQL